MIYDLVGIVLYGISSAGIELFTGHLKALLREPKY